MTAIAYTPKQEELDSVTRRVFNLFDRQLNDQMLIELIRSTKMVPPSPRSHKLAVAVDLWFNGEIPSPEELKRLVINYKSIYH